MIARRARSAVRIESVPARAAPLRARLAACALLGLCACRHTAGSIEDGRYVAHDNAFSLPVPKLSVGMAVQQGLDKDPFGEVTAGYVTFHDDFGNMRSIEYETLTSTELNALNDETRARNYFSERLHDQYVAKMKVHFPGTRVVEERLVTLDDGAMGWFAMIKIPVPESTRANGASTAARAPEGGRASDLGRASDPGRSTETARSPEVARGFLFLPHRKLFLTLSLANDPNGTLGLAESEAPTEAAEAERVKRDLFALYESMRFG